MRIASPLTQAQKIRLESVQLAYRHDRTPKDIIDRASELAAYVERPRASAKGKPKAVNDQQVEPDTDLI